MKLAIKTEDLEHVNGISGPDFPKYTSQLINWANQNAQATRARIVGQLSEIFPEYQSSAEEISPESWREWYLERYPDAIDVAAGRIYEQVENLKAAIKLIDGKMVHDWVEDLIISKTYNGLYIQRAVLAKIAEEKGLDWRPAKPGDDKRNISGYVGDTPYSVRPAANKTMSHMPETSDVKIAYYTKTKKCLNIDVED